MEVSKDGLGILSTLLNAAPIPEPFKSAVTVIPAIALQILTIVETVKGNAEDAKALVIYIANVTSITMRPFETKPQGTLDSGPAMMKRMDNFRGCVSSSRNPCDPVQTIHREHRALERIKDEMQVITSRRLRLRVFHYARDAATLAAFKTGVDEAVKHIQVVSSLLWQLSSFSKHVDKPCSWKPFWLLDTKSISSAKDKIESFRSSIVRARNYWPLLKDSKYAQPLCTYLMALLRM
ncbi:hypothetical protein FRB93_005424 [Tulasnella sp. JGI-2019a]|nr:hypothetical protein FRB93_005424 [Tulasnella sp. JGI-2019a]